MVFGSKFEIPMVFDSYGLKTLNHTLLRAWEIETHFSVSHGSDSDRDPGAKRPEILGFSAFMKEYFRLLASTFQSNETTISIYR